MSNKKEKLKLVKIVYPPLDEMPEDVYSNNVRVSHGQEDFVLYFGKVDPPPILEGEKFKGDKIKAKVVARVRLAPSVVIGLSRALSENIKKFQEKNKK